FANLLACRRLVNTRGRSRGQRAGRRPATVATEEAVLVAVVTSVEVDDVGPSRMRFGGRRLDVTPWYETALLRRRRHFVAGGGAWVEPELHRVEPTDVVVAEPGQLHRFDAVDPQRLPLVPQALGALGGLARLERDRVVLDGALRLAVLGMAHRRRHEVGERLVGAIGDRQDDVLVLEALPRRRARPLLDHARRHLEVRRLDLVLLDLHRARLGELGGVGVGLGHRLRIDGGYLVAFGVVLGRRFVVLGGVADDASDTFRRCRRWWRRRRRWLLL